MSSKYEILFHPMDIGSVTIKNSIGMSFLKKQCLAWTIHNIMEI